MLCVGQVQGRHLAPSWPSASTATPRTGRLLVCISGLRMESNEVLARTQIERIPDATRVLHENLLDKEETRNVVILVSMVNY